MGPLARLLAGLCAALLAVGAAGVALYRTNRRVAPPAAATRRSQGPTAPAIPGPSTPERPTGAAGPSSAAIRAGLITPTDMGDHYRIDVASAAALLDSAPCLAVLQASPAQSGRALTALLGPGPRSVPTVVEEVASYPTAAARAVFASVVSALGACSALSFDLGGTPVTAPVSRASLPPVGQADQTWSGTFQEGGVPYSVEYGAVLEGGEVVSLVWIDSIPPSEVVTGSFASTLGLAVAKLS